LFLALFDILAALLTTLFGMIYPSYMSWKVSFSLLQAIEKNIDEQKKIWLTYWIVFGFLTSIDSTFWFVLQYVPGFYAIRFIVYVWMFYPREKNGATIIYTALKPILQKFNQTME
jgi:receptor expression-enhancing protein 5/6